MKLRSCLYGIPSPSCKSYADQPWNDRVAIVKLYDHRFNPTDYVKDEECPYNQEWWDTLTRDERSAAYWTAMHPERTQKGWVDKQEKFLSAQFNDEVIESNALAWYEECPNHLRKQIDTELSNATTASEAPYSSELYQRVAQTWGDRPRERAEHAGEDIETFHWLEEWVREYDRLQMISVIMKEAPRIQKERKMLAQALGIKQGGSGFPSQVEGLEDTQAAAVNWLQSTGEMPLEFLANTYRDEEAKMSDRITAARTLMDYVHRKVSQKQEIETKDVSINEPKLNPEVLKSLNAKELETLEKLLSKMSKE